MDYKINYNNSEVKMNILKDKVGERKEMYNNR